LNLSPALRRSRSVGRRRPEPSTQPWPRADLLPQLTASSFLPDLLVAGGFVQAWVIQTPSHTPYAGYGGFTNFANAAVRRYQIDVAIAAARAGVDDILYDYVRRPDGPLSSMRFPGLQGSPEGAIVRFLEESRRALKPYGTYLGASVFGVAATRPTEVAQPIRRMAESVDYVAPMVYPSHWGRGEYNVANPNSQPFEIVQRSLADFNRDVRGSGARVVPWLQDFTLGVTYGPAQVRAQIDAARRDGIGEFILWDPAVTYTADALATDAKQPTAGLAKRASATEPTKKTTPVRRAGGRLPNELGQIPVLVHHEIRPDRVGPYDQTPAEFRAELERLWRSDYWPVTAGDLVEGNLGRVPAGKTPIVLSSTTRRATNSSSRTASSSETPLSRSCSTSRGPIPHSTRRARSMSCANRSAVFRRRRPGCDGSSTTTSSSATTRRTTFPCGRCRISMSSASSRSEHASSGMRFRAIASGRWRSRSGRCPRREARATRAVARHRLLRRRRLRRTVAVLTQLGSRCDPSDSELARRMEGRPRFRCRVLAS
jgi:Putative glycosyl hydrolase domain